MYNLARMVFQNRWHSILSKNLTNKKKCPLKFLSTALKLNFETEILQKKDIKRAKNYV